MYIAKSSFLSSDHHASFASYQKGHSGVKLVRQHVYPDCITYLSHRVVVNSLLTSFSASRRLCNSNFHSSCLQAFQYHPILPKSTPHHRPASRLPPAYLRRLRTLHSKRHQARSSSFSHSHYFIAGKPTFFPAISPASSISRITFIGTS